MPTFTLFVKAELENIEKVEFPNLWYVTVQQTGGDETKAVAIDPTNEEEITGSRGHCNFQMKWPGGKKESHANVVEAKKGQQFLSAEKAADFVPVISFECRGLEPIEWDFKSGEFRCTSTSEKVFENVTFEEGDWYDVDEETGESVGVTNIEYKIERTD